MTLPDERYRAIRYTWEFLMALLDPKETPRVPKEIRRWAGLCIRHFPRGYDMEEARKKAPKVWGKP